MDDITKELCYTLKLAMVKAVIDMKNEDVWALVTKNLEKVGEENENRRKPEREIDERPHGKGTV